MLDLVGFESLKVAMEGDGRVVVVEFDHGKANEMGSAQLAEIERLTAYLVASGAVVLISLSRRRTAKGTPIFIAGANVAERTGWAPAAVIAHVEWQRRVLAALRRAPVFHVAVVDGVALGWGTEYLLTCDWRIAADSAEFGLPETGLGILPGAGGTSDLWSQIGVSQALRLGMTGERIRADEALRIGLVQERVADVDAGLARARALAAMVAKKSPTAVAAFKAAVLESAGAAACADVEAQAYRHCVETGEAAIGRASFEVIRQGEPVAWGTRFLWKPET